MNQRMFRLARFVGFAVLLLLVPAAFVSAQDTRPAEQAYKNIKVMTGVPANQVIQGMHLIKAALGVECTHCHIQGQWDRDDVALKDKARKMYLMMTDINRTQFGGSPVVSCYTCHKGHAIPEDTPLMPAPDVAAEVTAATRPALPAIDVVLAKYIAALGGEPAMRKVTTRVITATQNVPVSPVNTVPATLERSLKAPNLVVDLFKTEKFTIADGFDGKVSWAKGQNGNVNSPAPGGVDAERAERAAAFYEPLTMKQQYRTMTVDAIEPVNGHQAFVVTGFPMANTPERLYFDMESGLLLRKLTYLVTATGKSPFQVDYDDYRDTGSGVKIPFLIHFSPAGPRTELQPTSTLRVTKVQDNVPVDDSAFVKPAAPPPAAPRQ